jgi:CheY-like chemotaxis protein
MTKILIAEDERDIRDLITFTLRFGGYEVVAASNGEEAVAMAKQEIPDMILLDVRMPRMTGYEACAAIKAVQRLKDIPVIFLSAKGQESEIQAGLQAGAAEYLLKPFAPDQLISRIKSVLSKAGSGATATSGPGANPPAVKPAKAAVPAPTPPAVPPPSGKPPEVPFTPTSPAAPPPVIRPAEERRPVTGPFPARPAEPKPVETPPVQEPPAPAAPPPSQPPQAGTAGAQPVQPPPPAVKPAEERPAETMPGSGGRLESSRIRRYLFGNRTPTPDTGAADDKPADGGQAGGKPSGDNPPDISRTWHQLFGAKPAESKPEENKPAEDTPAENPAEESHPSGDKPADETPPEA